MGLARYLARGVFVRAGVSGLLLISIYISIDFVEAASALKVPLLDLLVFYPSRLPLIVAHTFPIALTIGVQLTLSSARRNGEWDAIESAGISKLKITTWLLIIPLFAVFLSALNLMHLTPSTLKTWMKVKNTESVTKAHAPVWCKQEGYLVSDQAGSMSRIEIDRQKDGTAKTFLFTDSNRVTREWRRNQGWTEKAPKRNAGKNCSKSTKEVFMTPPMVLDGAAWTASELDSAIHRATENGWQVAPLKAEQSLRIALSLACLIIPLLGLGLSLKRREWGASKLVGMAVIAASAFWLSLAAAWNGAALGAWSPLFVSVIVPGVFFALGSAMILVFEKV